MGDMYQIDLVKNLIPQIKYPILEIGSKRYGPAPKYFNFRSLFENSSDSYLGVDISPGEGVDVALDLTADWKFVEETIGGRKFNTVICLSVMEHVKDIYRFAQNVDRLMAEGALFILSVPFVWGVHDFPDDYWRFTPRALAFLYPNFQFDPILSQLHTANGNVIKLKELYQIFNGDINKCMKEYDVHGFGDHCLPLKIMDNLLRRLKKLFEKPNTSNEMYYMTAFDMIGIKNTVREIMTKNEQE